MNNYEAIKNMTFDEMVKFFLDLETNEVSFCADCENADCNHFACESGISFFLEKEVNNENT